MVESNRKYFFEFGIHTLEYNIYFLTGVQGDFKCASNTLYYPEDVTVALAVHIALLNVVNN